MGSQSDSNLKKILNELEPCLVPLVDADPSTHITLDQLVQGGMITFQICFPCAENTTLKFTPSVVKHSKGNTDYDLD